MSYLSDNCTFRMFTPSLVADGAKFVCGDSDLDEFFHEDAIKAWLVDPMNKTGCRFVLVDSYNQEKNFKFYERNGFKFLFSSEEQEREFRDLKPDKPLNTRLMYFDLIELLN